MFIFVAAAVLKVLIYFTSERKVSTVYRALWQQAQLQWKTESLWQKSSQFHWLCRGSETDINEDFGFCGGFKGEERNCTP